jgi:hypothetical protein
MKSMAQVPFNLPPLISIDLYLSGSSFCLDFKTLISRVGKTTCHKTVHAGSLVNVCLKRNIGLPGYRTDRRAVQPGQAKREKGKLVHLAGLKLG